MPLQNKQCIEPFSDNVTQNILPFDIYANSKKIRSSEHCFQWLEFTKQLLVQCHLRGSENPTSSAQTLLSLVPEAHPL